LTRPQVEEFEVAAWRRQAFRSRPSWHFRKILRRSETAWAINSFVASAEKSERNAPHRSGRGGQQVERYRLRAFGLLLDRLNSPSKCRRCWRAGARSPSQKPSPQYASAAAFPVPHVVYRWCGSGTVEASAVTRCTARRRKSASGWKIMAEVSILDHRRQVLRSVIVSCRPCFAAHLGRRRPGPILGEKDCESFCCRQAEPIPMGRTRCPSAFHASAPC